MNARQKCKKLKRRNKLLMNIVNANPDFLRVFDYWTNRPFKVESSHVHLQTYAVTYPIEPMLDNRAREFAEKHIVYELSNAIKDNIEWKIIAQDTPYTKLEGRIIVAEKECN